MPRQDAQTDQMIANLIASYEERVEIARLAQITLAVEMAAAVDLDVKLSYASQIVNQQRDVEVLNIASAELGKIAGKPDSGRKVRLMSTAAVEAASALLAGVPLDDPPV